MNKIILIGNLGKDPDMNYTTNGIPVTKFTLAVSRKVKAAADSEMKEETEWFTIIVWRNLAEICNEFLKKGKKVYIEGRLTQRKYTDREGIQRIAVEVIANDMEMLSPKQQAAEEVNDDVDALLAELEQQE
jgi:single-strand DNA-binding protein